ncbi:hypothetical protein N9383_04650 [Granulosicoccus sp.]|nr:hypothetical protein [Granulosicoccus sp.]
MSQRVMAAAVFVGLYTVQHLFQLVSRFGQVDHQRESLLHLISEKLTEHLPHIMALSVHIVIFFCHQPPPHSGDFLFSRIKT